MRMAMLFEPFVISSFNGGLPTHYFHCFAWDANYRIKTPDAFNRQFAPPFSSKKKVS
jgi:hypothetical protein